MSASKITNDAIAILCGCVFLVSTPAVTEVIDPPIYFKRPPAVAVTVDIPKSLRHRNYSGGSCMWASTWSAFEWCGRHDLAKWGRRNFAGAAGIHDIERMCKRAKVPYESTHSGDVAVLERATKERRAAAIYWKSGHACTFMGFFKRRGKEFAVILDNNSTGRYEWTAKNEFLSRWRGHGGGAIVPLLTPTPARPYNPLDFQEKVT